MSLRNPFAELAGIVLGKSDLQSIFCLLVFCIVTLVLGKFRPLLSFFTRATDLVPAVTRVTHTAYLTNPTENSFRTYLTEQSFRHHLSRLDDNLDNEQSVHDGLSSRAIHSACLSRSMTSPTADRNGPFHFANRASISLRTPKHVFHSFAIFTIAAMVPVPKGSSTSSVQDTADGWSISDSWYIGAFGKWWRGGVWETWYQDVIARSKDEESWSSGILSMKNLDMLPDFRAGSYIPKTLPYHLLKQSPPRLRNRDIAAAVHNSKAPPTPRSSSPPPLSKSASLPLHAKRHPALPTDRCDYLSSPSSCLPMTPSGVGAHGAPSRSTLFDQSPLIAEVLRQISTSTASLQDLRNQYSEYQASASQSREILNLELDSHRDRKRQEDAARSELKTKTKNLDDQKRTAEGHKREAERKLKATRTTRDKALHRIEFLDKESATLQERTNSDREILAQKSATISEVELELSHALDRKKTEIKAAEEELLSVNRRSRELEEKLSMERERLEALKLRAERRMKQQASAAYLSQALLEGSAEDASYAPRPHAAVDSTTQQQQHFSVHEHPPPSYGPDSPSSPIHADGSHASLHQYAMYPEGSPLAESPSYEITGYASKELDFSPAARRAHYSLIGNNAPSDHLMEFSKSFQLENDPSFNQSWNNSSLYSLSSTDSTSTSASLYSNFTDSQRDAPSLTYDHVHGFDDAADPYSWPQQDSGLGPVDEMGYYRDEFSAGQAVTTGGRQKKGLNPGAKVFSLPRKLSPPSTFLNLSTTSTTYDALNPNGLVISSLPSASSNSTCLLRTFAPSRAEREALQRALGGSTNSSLERLPSLSEVGSIPSSPSHAHATARNIDLSHTTKGPSAVSHKTFHLPSWLTVLPNIRKSRFKPWDDEDSPAPTGNGQQQIEAFSQKA